MDDLINRQAAIDALKSQLSDWNDDYNIPVRKSIENIERLPSAQPEIKNPCSECQEFECYGCESKKDFHGGSNEY